MKRFMRVLLVILLAAAEMILASPAETAQYCGIRGGSLMRNSIISLDVRARLPFQVFTLDGPGSGSRLVVDVAHRW